MHETSSGGPASADKKWTVGTLTYTRAGLAATVVWLLVGGFAWALKDRAGQPIAQLLLNDYGESDTMSLFLIGSVPSILALLFFPFFGYFSDRWRSPWGRRIPFIAMAIPFVVVSLCGIAASPWLGRSLDFLFDSVDGATIFCLTAFWTLLAFADILGNLILSGLVNDVIPRRIIGRVFGGFRAVSLFAGIVFNYFLFGRAESLYVPILLGAAVIAFAALGLMCLKVKEGDYPAIPKAGGIRTFPREAASYFRECFGSSFYWLLFIAWAFGSTAWNPANFYSVLFSSTLVTPEHYANLVSLTFIVSFMLAYPLGILADRFHPIRVSMVALAFYCLATFWGGFCDRTALNFDITFVLHGVLSGCFLTASASLLLRLLPRQRFTQFASAAGIAVSLLTVLAAPIPGYIIGAVELDYRYVFLLSSVQAAVGFLAMAFLYRSFMARGGDTNFIPPGEVAADA
jgi:MFS family permease